MALPNIVVVARRIFNQPPPPPAFDIAPPGEPGAGDIRGGEDRILDDGILAFLAPAIPEVIEEIIVTAPRPGAAPATTPGFGGLLSRMGLAGVVGGVLGLTAREIIDELGEQLLEREFAELMAEGRADPGDTPLELMPEAQPIPEIIVTAKRLEVIGQYYLPPLPQFFPREADVDPWIMQPITPRTQPQTQPQIDVEVLPDIAFPTLPEVAPTTPALLPIFSPGTIVQPQTRPRVDPRTQPEPQTRPRTRPKPQTDPLTSFQPAVGTSVGTATSPLAGILPRTLAMPEAAQTECPPCKDKQEREKPRKECWRKMVKEAVFPSWDEEYQWVQIDCLTGREL